MNHQPGVLIHHLATTSSRLEQALLQQGLRPIRLSLMAIAPVQLDESARMRALADVRWADGLVVFSPRGADALAELLAAQQVELPTSLRLFAMGRDTAHSLQSSPQLCDLEVTVPQTGSGSEALLRDADKGLNALKRPLLVGGYGMRPLLRLHFASRHTEVRQLHLYRRLPVAMGPSDQQKLCRALADASALVASSTSLLYLLAARADALGADIGHLHLAATSKRIAAAGHRLGLASALAAESPCQLAGALSKRLSGASGP